MKEEPFKTMTASAKIMYAVLMEKQQKAYNRAHEQQKALEEYLAKSKKK